MRALLFLLLCSSLLLGCSNEPDSLRIGSKRVLGYAPIFLANEFDWTTSANIRLVEYASSNGVVRGMQNGLLDAALLSLDEAIALQSIGHDLEILLIANISAGAEVLYARSDIRHTAELNGKRIAIESRILGGYFLTRILNNAGLTRNDVEIISLPAYMHVDAINKGMVDVTISTAAKQAQLQAVNFLPLVSSRDLPDEIINVLVVNRERTSPELRARLRALWFSSLTMWFDYRANNDKRLNRRLGLDQQSLELILNGMIMGDQALNNLYFANGVLAKRIEHTQAVMLDNDLLTEPINVNQLLPNCTGDAC